MTLPEEDAKQRARKRAQDMQLSLEQTVQDERDTEALLERLDKLAADLFELAQDWDSVDPQMAVRVREQEQQVHDLRSRLERLGELEANEATKIIGAIKNELKRARGDG